VDAAAGRGVHWHRVESESVGEYVRPEISDIDPQAMGLPRVLLSLGLAALARALQGGSCSESSIDECSTAGEDAAYAETIDGDVRRIRSAGCPNNNPLTNCLASNPRPASLQDWIFDIPASPKFNAATYEASLANALSLTNIGGASSGAILPAAPREKVFFRAEYRYHRDDPEWRRGPELLRGAEVRPVHGLVVVGRESRGRRRGHVRVLRRPR